MNIVYVSDNRCRGNYGCRATSTALSQLLQHNNSIVGRVSGKNTNFSTSDFFFLEGLPGWVYKLLGRQKHWKYWRKLLFMGVQFLRKRNGLYLSKSDFISTDLDKSIANLLKCIPANPELREFDLSQYDFDAIVVNGEGSFIFSKRPWRESLIISMEIHWAHKLGKKVYFTNAMFSDDPYSQRNIETINLVDNLLGKCSLVSVRELDSLNYVHSNMPSVKAILIPDALFTWYNLVNDDFKVNYGKYIVPMEAATDESYYEFDFNGDYFLITGSSATGNASNNLEDTINAYVNLTRIAIKTLQMKCFLVEACEGDSFMHEVGKRTNTPVVHLKTPIVAAAKILANARVYITGRYHPAILSSLGGTPCVFMSSNSHKTLSLQRLLEYENLTEFNLIPDVNECERISNSAFEKIKQGEMLRNSIKNKAFSLSVEAYSLVDYIK